MHLHIHTLVLTDTNAFPSHLTIPRLIATEIWRVVGSCIFFFSFLFKHTECKVNFSERKNRGIVVSPWEGFYLLVPAQTSIHGGKWAVTPFS